ncbi:nuclear pore complex protein Nup50 [Discoglossus pictus]
MSEAQRGVAKMAKRLADKELTDRNWDQEEEAEDAGTFSVASQDVLKSREIKKAKRRTPGSENESGGAFKGFKGLLPSGGGFSLSPSGGTSSVFGNGSGAKPLESLTNGSGNTSNKPLFPTFKTTETKPMFGSMFANGPSAPTAGTSSAAKTNGERTLSTSGSGPNKSCNSDYNKQLTSLNYSVRDWIVKHVNANPLCDLTPIFKDYEKHLSSIEQKYGAATDSGSESDGNTKLPHISPTFGCPKSVDKPTTFSFGIKASTPEKQSPTTEEKKTQPAPTFNFGQKVDSSAFGSTGAAAGFSFSSGASNLFGKDTNKSSAPPSSATPQNSEDAGDGDEEAPPKAIINEVKEDDAFYSKKCKLFYKKDNEFKEKGVGTLHLKPVGNQKTQLLIRADTNLGNILLNILVQPSMPCSRTGKNNVIIVCVPNPPVDEKNPTIPLTMLIRVKSTEDADELHKLLLEKKEV